MSILANINPFKKKPDDQNGSKADSMKQEPKDRAIDPHETGGCCGGCGGLEETNK